MTIDLIGYRGQGRNRSVLMVARGGLRDQVGRMIRAGWVLGRITRPVGSARGLFAYAHFEREPSHV